MPHESVPRLRLHRPSGRAVVTLPDGLGGRRDIYLGRYGSAASKAAYEREIAQWQGSGRKLPAAVPTDQISIAELVNHFHKYA